MTVHGFLSNLNLNDVPIEVVEFTKRCIRDLLAVAVSGRQTQLSRLIHAHAVDQFNTAGTGVGLWFSNERASAAGAALANGMTIDAMDAHDGHKLTKGHVGCGVLPAALAMLENENITDGSSLLKAVLIGYEIGTRAGIALHKNSPDYHTSGAWISLACASIGASVLELDDQLFKHAVGIAEYHGPRSQMMRCIDHPTMLKDGSGWGAMSGVSAAYLAKSGFTGAPAVTMESNDLAHIWKDLGQRWYILEQYFKPQPVCRWAQPSMQAMISLKQAYGFNEHDISRINVATFHEAKRLATRVPRTTEEAQYSLPFPVACAAIYGKVEPEHVSDLSVNNQKILNLANKVTISEDDHFNNEFPRRRFADVSIVFEDGSEIKSGPMEARGEPENHLSDAEMRDKFFAYCNPQLGEERAKRLSSEIDNLDQGRSLATFLQEVHAPIN